MSGWEQSSTKQNFPCAARGLAELTVKVTDMGFGSKRAARSLKKRTVFREKPGRIWASGGREFLRAFFSYSSLVFHSRNGIVSRRRERGNKTWKRSKKDNSGTLPLPENLEKLLTDCTLCPRNCHVNRMAGQIGYLPADGDAAGGKSSAALLGRTVHLGHGRFRWQCFWRLLDAVRVLPEP